MEEASSVNDKRGKRQRKCTDDPVCAGSHPTGGVVVWDIDDTIVIIQASLKQHRDIYQLELVKSVKNYLTAYLDKEFYFNSTLHMEVVERLVDWEKEPLPSSDAPTLNEPGELVNTNCKLGNDVIATGKSYSAFLKSQYRAFQKLKDESSEVSTPTDISLVDNKENDVKNACTTMDSRYDRLPPGWRETYEAMESKTLLWTQQARSVLSHLKKNNVRNMIVTASELAPAVAKLIMWDLFEFFDIDDIYSSAKKAKTTVFEHLLQDLGRSPHIPQYVAACGDGPDEERAAAHFSIPFKRILCPRDLYSVPGLLRSDLAMEEPEKYSQQSSGPSDVDESSQAYCTKTKADLDILVGCTKQLMAYYANDTVHVDQGARLTEERAAIVGQPT